MMTIPAMSVPGELFTEGLRLGFLDLMRDPEMRERVARAIAEAAKSELMTTAEAAEELRCTPKTLLTNHVDWELDKSIALGADNPRFYRSQIMARMRAKDIKGRKADGVQKVTNFPQSTSTGSVPVGKQKAS